MKAEGRRRTGLITLRGWGVTAAGAVLLCAGFFFGYPELAVLGAIALIALGVALLHAALRPELSVKRAVDPDRVERGDSSRVTLTIRNTGKFGAATLLANDRCGRQTVPVPLLRLRRGRQTDVDYPVPTHRRGIVTVGPLQLTRRDPLGLVSFTRSHGGTNQIWVYPKAHLMRSVPAGISRSLDGRLDRVPHGAITFDALREYVIGDELRHVHWRTSARVGELMVREHVDTSLPRLVVLLDDRIGSWPTSVAERGRQLSDGITCDEFESACEAAASIIGAAVRDDLTITLQLVSGGAAASGRVRGSARGLLDLLAEADLASRDPQALATATNRLRQHRPGDTLVYLTGTGGHADLALVTGLRGPFPAVAVGMLGPRVPNEPESLGVLMLRAEDGPEFASVWDGVARW